MPATITDFYEVRFEARPPLLRGRVLRPLSEVEFTEVCELLLAQARPHRCAWWLLDGRADAGSRSPQVYEWMKEDFLPRVRRALGRPPSLAFLARADFWQELRAQSYAPPQLQSPSFQASWFTDEATALAWLDRQRPAPHWAAE